MPDSMEKTNKSFLYRSLFYFGPEDWLLDCIKRRGVKGQYATDKVRIIEGDCALLSEALPPDGVSAYLRPAMAPYDVELVVYKDHQLLCVKPLSREVCCNWIKQLVDGAK